MKQTHRCWAEINLHALRHNLLWIRQRAGHGVKVMTVVKADAYGHGLKPIAAWLMQNGTDLFGVANLEEARAIRRVGPGWPILMLGACLPHEVDLALRDHVMPTISSIEEAACFARAARRRNVTCRVHVKVDTGMGRLGVPHAAAVDLVSRMTRLKGVEVEGLYTHFASAEDNPGFTRLQRERFQKVRKGLHTARIPIPLVHASHSAGLLHEPDGTCNLVRPGLLVYGIAPPGWRVAAAGLEDQLEPALSFHCRVALVKGIRKGAPLSYGGTFVAPRKMRIATITCGYGDGYLRSGSNRAHVLIRGERCAVVGRITMDQSLVDVSALRSVSPGDETVLIGRQGSNCISANDLAEWCGTVPWEIFTSISYRVPRIYRGSHAA